MTAPGRHKKRRDQKDAPNLRRFRNNVLEMVNKKLGIDSKLSEVKEESAMLKESEKEAVQKPLPRKVRRKHEKLLKKARKVAYSQHRKLPTSIEELKPQKEQPKEQRPSGAQRRKKAKAKKKKAEEQKMKNEEEKKAQARVSALHAQIAEDDKIIKKLSKQMKLNKRKRKNLPAAFTADGLDYLLDAVDSEKLASIYKNTESGDESDIEEPKVKRTKVKDDFAEGDDDDLSLIGGEEMEDSSDNVMMSDDESEEHDQAESDENDDDDDDDDDDDEEEEEEEDGAEATPVYGDEDDEGGSNAAGASDGNDSDSSDDDNQESEPTVREDIYGRPIDKTGKVIQTPTSGSAYIPPAKRAAMLANTEKEKVVLERLSKRVKGLLNRLSEMNLASISSDIEAMYRSNSRALMNQTLLSNTKQPALSLSALPDRLVMVQTMLVAVLHSNVDIEIGACILQAYVKEMDTLLKANDLAATQKQLDNLILFICYLYHFRVVGSMLILDVLKRLCEVFEEKHIELIILVLKTVGFNLRKDDAAGLKAVIVQVQEKANSADLTSFTDQSRVRFMLDILLAIRNNNTRKLPQYDPDAAMHARKIVSQVVRSSGESGQLQISLRDLLASEEHGAWWRIGSAWSGHKPDQSDQPTAQTEPSPEADDTSTDLLELARKQRMNTEVRRKIFCTIMGSSDYLDCSEKLLRLGLNHRQEQEIVHVLIDCCLQERRYNPYYSHLAEKLCKTHRRYAITCQFSIWDRLKTLNDLNRSAIANLAQFISHLISQSALSVSLFKVLNLAELDKASLNLTRKVLLNLILRSDAKVTEIFAKVSQSSKYGQLAISLNAFIQHFIMKNCEKLKLDCSVEVLQRKVGIVERALAGENRFGL